MDDVNECEFDESTLDKVYRLLELLDEIERHPALRGKVALHGGTAINLFMLDVPRLSVDIDLSYIGALERVAMLEERPVIERSLCEVAKTLGYKVALNAAEHAGSTFHLSYRGPKRDDHVKIDVTFLNRSVLINPVLRKTPLSRGLTVRVLSDAELIGGKVKAYFDRVKVRDLYDIANLHRCLGGEVCARDSECQILHEVALYYASMSARFPFGFEGREQRFADCGTEVEKQLYPMLRGNVSQGRDWPDLESMMAKAAAFVAEWVLPRSHDEREYLRRLESGEYEPGLLFSNREMTRRAMLSPQALWKVENLRKML